MAAFANCRRRQVGGRLAGRLGTIVAAGAISGDTTVVEGRRGPAGGLVAILTHIVGCDMVGRFAGRLGAIVAAETVGADAAMAESCRCPARGLVAVLTDIIGRDVVS